MILKASSITIGIIFVLLGVVGMIFVEPPLLTPLHPTDSFWFWHNLRHVISVILQLIGVSGIVLLILGVIRRKRP